MPFTASHPAAVLPLMGGGLVPSALVIGSMAPDLPYFVPIPVAQASTHSVVGIVTVDLAIAAVCFAIWQLLVAPAAVALAPRGLRARLAPHLPVPASTHLGSVRALVLVGMSLVAGAATHVAWDAFTHEGRWGVRQIDALAATYGPLAGYRWAQYLSGALGLAVLVIAVALWWRRSSPGGRAAASQRLTEQRVPAVAGRGAWIVWVAIIGLATATGVFGFAEAITAGRGERVALYRGATWGGGTGILALLATALITAPLIRLRMRRAS